MHLICPQCQARNRVAESDLAKEVCSLLEFLSQSEVEVGEL